MTRTTIIRLLRLVIALVVLVIIVIYSLGRTENYALGPTIDIYFPENGHGTTSPIIKITGNAQRINSLFLNGATTTIDELGNFSEEIIVFEGINYISLEAHDRFNRMIKKQLMIYREI